MANKKIDEILVSHEMFYIKINGTYVLFFHEEDLELGGLGANIHRTGAQNKRELIQYLEVVDMDFAASQLRKKVARSLYEEELSRMDRQIPEDIQDEHIEKLIYVWKDNCWTRSELCAAIRFYISKA